MRRWWEDLEWWFWKQRRKRRWQANTVIWFDRWWLAHMDHKFEQACLEIGMAVYEIWSSSK